MGWVESFVYEFWHSQHEFLQVKVTCIIIFLFFLHCSLFVCAGEGDGARPRQEAGAWIQTCSRVQEKHQLSHEEQEQQVCLHQLQYQIQILMYVLLKVCLKISIIPWRTRSASTSSSLSLPLLSPISISILSPPVSSISWNSSSTFPSSSSSLSSPSTFL